MKQPKDAKLDFYLSRAQGLSKTSADRIAQLLKIAGGLETERFLDVGCGDGSLSLLVKQVSGAKEIFGVEVSVKAARQARSKGISVSRLDIEKAALPYEDCSFDLVLCGDLLEHVFDPSDVLDEISRVLEPNGVLLLTAPNLASWYNRLLFPFGFQPMSTAASLSYPQAGKLRIFDYSDTWRVSGWGGEHLRVLTLRAIKDLLKAHGFKVSEVKGAYGVFAHNRPHYKIAQFFDKLMARWSSMATWLVVKAVKQ